MSTFDDSALFHSELMHDYDPVKAREYYLRTRKLKGRKKGVAKTNTMSNRGSRPSVQPKKPVGPRQAKADELRRRRAAMEAKRAALQKRLDELTRILREAVRDAKKRSGVKTPAKPSSSSSSSTKSSPKSSTKSRSSSSSSKNRKPETAAQKAKRAKAAKERYEKEKPNTLSRDIEILEKQVEDRIAEIKKVRARLAQNAPRSKTPAKTVRAPIVRTQDRMTSSTSRGR